MSFTQYILLDHPCLLTASQPFFPQWCTNYRKGARTKTLNYQYQLKESASCIPNMSCVMMQPTRIAQNPGAHKL